MASPGEGLHWKASLGFCFKAQHSQEPAEPLGGAGPWGRIIKAVSPLQNKSRAGSSLQKSFFVFNPTLAFANIPPVSNTTQLDLPAQGFWEEIPPPRCSQAPNSPRCSLLFSTAGSVFLRGMVAAMGASPKLSPGWGLWGGLPHRGSVCPGFGGRGGGAAGESLAATARALWFLSSVNVLGIW